MPLPTVDHKPQNAETGELESGATPLHLQQAQIHPSKNRPHDGAHPERIDRERQSQRDPFPAHHQARYAGQAGPKEQSAQYAEHPLPHRKVRPQPLRDL